MTKYAFTNSNSSYLLECPSKTGGQCSTYQLEHKYWREMIETKITKLDENQLKLRSKFANFHEILNRIWKKIWTKWNRNYRYVNFPEVIGRNKNHWFLVEIGRNFDPCRWYQCALIAYQISYIIKIVADTNVQASISTVKSH